MWRNPQVTTDLVTFTEEILNEKLYFLRSGSDLILFNETTKTYFNLIIFGVNDFSLKTMFLLSTLGS